MTAVRTLRRLVAGAWLLAVVGLIGLALVTLLAPTMVIRGASMAPAVPVGSLAFMETSRPSDLRTGDVVTVRADNGVLVTHRIGRLIEVNDSLYLELRGDANPAPDPVLVPARSVVGRVASVMPFLGFLIVMLSTLAGLAALCSALVCGLIAIWLLEEWEGQMESPPAAPARPAPRPAKRRSSRAKAQGAVGGTLP